MRRFRRAKEDGFVPDESKPLISLFLARASSGDCGRLLRVAEDAAATAAVFKG